MSGAVLGWELPASARLSSCTPAEFLPSATPPLQGFPTIKLFAPGSSAPQDYNGPRSAKGLADAAVGTCGGMRCVCGVRSDAAATLQACRLVEGSAGAHIMHPHTAGMLSNKHVKQLKSQASALAWIQQHPGTKARGAGLRPLLRRAQPRLRPGAHLSCRRNRPPQRHHPCLQVVLVTDKPKTPPLYKSLSQRFTSQGAPEPLRALDPFSWPLHVWLGRPLHVWETPLVLTSRHGLPLPLHTPARHPFRRGGGQRGDAAAAGGAGRVQDACPAGTQGHRPVAAHAVRGCARCG